QWHAHSLPGTFCASKTFRRWVIPQAPVVAKSPADRRQGMTQRSPHQHKGGFAMQCNNRFRPQVTQLEDRSVPSSTNGIAGSMPTFYDGFQHTINFKPQPEHATQSLLAHNKSINVIYMSDTPLPGGAMFTSVIDALPAPGEGPGFNPLWQEV